MRNFLKAATGILLTLGGLYVLFKFLILAVLVPTQYASRARIVPPKSAFTTIAREMVIIKTPQVLSNVVQELRLGERLAKRFYQDSPMSDDMAMVILEHVITVKEDEPARLIEIHVLEEDNMLGASIANSVANAYCNHVRSRPAGTNDQASILEMARPSLHPANSTKLPILAGFGIGIPMALAGVAIVISTLKRSKSAPPLPQGPITNPIKKSF